MPKTTIKDLELVIEQKDAEIAELNEKLGRLAKIYQALKTMMELLGEADNGGE